jgi:hypothetical protein
VGNGPWSVAVGDFDGDGQQDLVTADSSAGTVSILLGQGNGSFTSNAAYAAGNSPISVAVGDFDGDGRQDLATANPGQGTVSILLNQLDAWVNLGFGLSGTTSIPHLAGTGTLQGGSSNSLDLSNALPGATTNLVLGLTSLYAGFKDGTMVPGPPWLFFYSLPVSATGTHSQPFTWPPGIPAGTKFWVQHWVADSGGAGSSGFAASNGLEGTAQ